MSETKKYAVVKSGGYQFRVVPGQRIRVPLTGEKEAGSEIVFDEILLASDGEKTVVGEPTVSGASVKATLLGTVKGKKLFAFKKKRRKGYKRKVGHRQQYSEVLVDSISL